MKLSDVLADQERLDSYDALFIPGGHAPMTDILFKNWFESDDLNKETGQLLRYFHETQKPTGLICHAPAVLGAALDVDDKWIYDGYNMTCVSALGEALVEDIPFFNSGGHLKDYPKPILERNGGNVKTVLLGKSFVVEDRELITAQDPFGGEELGRKFLAKVNKYAQEHRQTVNG